MNANHHELAGQQLANSNNQPKFDYRARTLRLIKSGHTNQHSPIVIQAYFVVCVLVYKFEL